MLARTLIVIAGILCITPFIGSGMALLLGVSIAILFGNPFAEVTRKLTHTLLSISIIGMGAGMDLAIVGKAGLDGIGYTVAGIAFAFLVGTLLGRALQIEKRLSMLITVGTAICGGSAIAAVAPAIKAKHHEISVALGTIFILNGIALLIFPPIGHALDLTQTQFGLWSALAIHDTSSVVGAALQYGHEALEIATTVKLARALWIIPISFVLGVVMAKRGESKGNEKTKKPWFILGFCVASALVTFIPELRSTGHVVSDLSKQVLVLTLFLIGLNLTKENIKMVGPRAFVQGVVLWAIVSTVTLTAIKIGFIH